MLNKFELKIGTFPFYWRTYKKEEELSYPVKNISFSLVIDKHSGFIKQKRHETLLNTIEEVYQLDHNIGYLQEGSDELRTYGKEYLDFIVNCIEKSKISNKSFKILDIGCGGGVTLAQLHEKYPNSESIGIEPSPLAKRSSIKFGFKLICEFYPPENRKEVKDIEVILHYDVLEHVEEPLSFLKDIFLDLSENGLMIFSVPDCTDSIENGDISMLIHEHLNYFTASSLKVLVEQVGFKEVVVEQGKVGGTLLCSAKKVSKNSNAPMPYIDATTDFKVFLEKNKKITQKVIHLIASNKDKTIAFYVPLRAIPYITMLNIQGPFRFFDDSRFFKNKYLDGFSDIEIEGIDDLETNPTDVVFIMTHAYGDIIKEKILNLNIKTKVISLKDLFK